MSATSTFRWLRAFPWLLCLALALGACASGGQGTGGSTTLEVQNNLIPPTTLSVYVVPEIGSRRLVGNVTPGATRVLRFDPPSAGGQFRFMATTTAGRDIVSNPVSFQAGESIRWDVNANLAVVTGG